MAEVESEDDYLKILNGTMSDTRSNPTQLALVVLPARWTAEYATPEYFADLGVPLVKAIARRHSTPLFKMIETLEEDDLKALEVIFQTQTLAEENAFWEDFIRMAAFKEGGGLAAARSLGFAQAANEGEDAHLARIYVDHSHIVATFLSSSVAQNSESSVARTFHVFQGNQPPQTLGPKMDRVLPEALKQILKTRLSEANYGNHCEVTILQSEGIAGFLVNRAGQLSRPSKVDGKTDKPAYDSHRLRKTDVLLYLPASNTLWIKTAAKGDIEIYRSALEEALGAPGAFSQRRNLDLPQIFRSDLGSSLREHMTSFGFSSLELKSYRFTDHEGVESKIKVDKAEPCRTVRLASSTDAHPGNTLIEAKLRFRKADEKQTISMDLKAATVRISAGVGIEEVDAVLTALKVWAPYGNA